VRLLITSLLFGAIGCCDVFTVPLGKGRLVIQAEFIHQDQFGSFIPKLVATIRNETSAPWRIKLEFNIGALCNGEPRQWTVPAIASLGWSKDHRVTTEYDDIVVSLIGKVDTCKAEIIEARLLFAENGNTRIEGTAEAAVDLGKQLQEIKAQHEAEAKAQAERDAAAAVRRKRLTAQERKKEAEANMKAAEERIRVRAACLVVYQDTIDKKIHDLTVREERQVQACQFLDLYPPQ